jgi:hypothetical protein
MKSDEKTIGDRRSRQIASGNQMGFLLAILVEEHGVGRGW